MITLLKTLVLSSRIGAQWEELDAGNLIVMDLFQQYRRIVLTIRVDPGAVTQFIDLQQLKAEYAQYTNTLNILLQTLDGRGFDTLAALPNSQVKYARYANAVYAGYHLQLAKAGVSLPPGASPELKPDVWLYRDNVFDPTDIHKYALTTVNGYIHNTEIANSRAYIKDAGKSMRHAQDNHVGILSFMDISEVHRVKLNETMISIPEGSLTLKEKIKLTIPAGYENKAFMLVLGGHLVIPEVNSFWRAGDRTFYLDLKQLSYIDRLLESQIYLDLTELGLVYSEINYKNLNLENAWSDAVLKRYLMMSQTFMVFLDVDEMIFDRHALRQMKIPGQFTAYQEPIYPLFLGSGRMADYWKQPEADRWSVKVTDSYRRLWGHSQEAEARLQNIFDQLSFNVPYHFSQGFLMEIGGYNHA